MSDRQLIRDLIYLDFDKTASIYSHLAGGLVTEVEDTYGKNKEKGGGLKAHVLSAGAKWTDSESSTVKQITHHDLLVDLENILIKEKVAFDLNDEFSDETPEIECIHGTISAKPYVRAEGNCRFHDFHRMQSYLDGLNRIFEFMNQSKLHNLGRVEEFQNLKEQIRNAEHKLAETKDRNKRKTQSKQLEKLKGKIELILEESIGSNKTLGIPDWQVEGIKDVINFLMPNRHNLLLQPFESLQDFQIISNLKRECFLDTDLDNVLFAYGSQPNVLLTIFGLVTSIPVVSDPQKPVAATKSPQTPANEVKQFEQLFKNFFDMTTQLERFGLFAYYPRVTVYPLAVYRTIRK